jgi:hypothetical protein
LPKPAREPYEALIRAITYQQLHAKAGDAILTKFMALFGDSKFPFPEQIFAMDFDSLRTCGFSGRTIETIRDIASGALSSLVPSRKAADKMSDEDLISRLVTLKGIGRWTVEMFLIINSDRQTLSGVGADIADESGTVSRREERFCLCSATTGVDGSYACECWNLIPRFPFAHPNRIVFAVHPTDWRRSLDHMRVDNLF